MSLRRIIVNMNSNINAIISILVLGFSWWIVGVDDNDRGKKATGAGIVLIGIIFNLLMLLGVSK